MRCDMTTSLALALAMLVTVDFVTGFLLSLHSLFMFADSPRATKLQLAEVEMAVEQDNPLARSLHSCM